MKDSLTFAQLSDPHLTSLLGVNWRDLINKRVLGYLSWHRRRRAEHRSEVLEALQQDLRRTRPEHVVVTGDLTHIGLPDEFLQARLWLESLGSPQDVTVIPGNHDVYVGMPWKDGLAHWQPWMMSDAATAVRREDPAGSIFPSLRIRGRVAFIGLSSARPSAPFFATGSIGAGQLERLATLLGETGRRGLFRVVLLHHPPVPGEEKWRKRLTDAARLCRVIAARGAELVLHGHRHRAEQSRIEIPGTHVPVYGIPSASAIGHKAGRIARYYLYRVQPAEDGWTLDVTAREFSPARAVFATEGEKRLQILRRPIPGEVAAEP